jgi:transcriptional regulator with XRE-family HTH domain
LISIHTQRIMLGEKEGRMATDRAKGRSTYKPKRPRAAFHVAEPAAAGLLLDQRLERLIATLGNNRVAELLGVSPSQPSRWRRGAERISADRQRDLLDLDYVVARLLHLFPKEQAEIWMTSHNAHLGARPVDVLRLSGAAAVVRAIDAEAQDAYA